MMQVPKMKNNGLFKANKPSRQGMLSIPRLSDNGLFGSSKIGGIPRLSDNGLFGSNKQKSTSRAPKKQNFQGFGKLNSSPLQVMRSSGSSNSKPAFFSKEAIAERSDRRVQRFERLNAKREQKAQSSPQSQEKDTRVYTEPVEKKFIKKTTMSEVWEEKEKEKNKDKKDYTEEYSQKEEKAKDDQIDYTDQYD